MGSAGDLLDHLDERAATLERLLDGHPGRHLLAEYEATVLERPTFCLADGAVLLTRIEQAISRLSATYRSEGFDHCP